MARVFLVFCTALLAMPASARDYRDGSGFRVNLPAGWQVAKSQAGHIVLASANPLEYVYVRPIFGRKSDCASVLRETLTADKTNSAGLENLQIGVAGRGVAIARYSLSRGAGRGATLCAETSQGAGMFYGATVPAAQYTREWPVVMAVLKSFSYEGGGPAQNNASLPAMQTWREPHEMAYTMSVPTGWQIAGGIMRQDVTHYTSAVQATNPDGFSGVRVGDGRYAPCTVPGPGYATMPQVQTGVQFCQYQSAAQAGDRYVRAVLARDLGLNGVEVTGAAERDDLARRADAIPASLGLRVKCSVAEIRFRATLRGTAVTGGVQAKTTLFFAAQGQNFIVGTLSTDLLSFWGRPEQFSSLGHLTGAMVASQRINPVWWSQTQQISRTIAEKTLATLQAEGEHQQQAFWDRMAASDRRRNAVNDVLGGTVRLSDGAGNQYQAKVGSNYYFLDTNAARTAGKPDEAVGGVNLWPSSTVDLQALVVMQ